MVEIEMIPNVVDEVNMVMDVDSMDADDTPVDDTPVDPMLVAYYAHIWCNTGRFRILALACRVQSALEIVCHLRCACPCPISNALGIPLPFSS